MTPLTPASLAELVALEKKATKGPWQAPRQFESLCMTVSIVSTAVVPTYPGNDDLARYVEPPNADFIAALRNAAPALLAIAEAAHSLKACAEVVCDNIEDDGDEGDAVSLLRDAIRRLAALLGDGT